MKTNFETTNDVVVELLKVVQRFYPNLKTDVDELYQLNVQMQPIVSNAIFHRDTEILEIERFKTLIALARTLDDETMEKVLEALKYQLTIKK